MSEVSMDYRASNSAAHAALAASYCLDYVRAGGRLSDSAKVCVAAAIRDLQLAAEGSEENERLSAAYSVAAE